MPSLPMYAGPTDFESIRAWLNAEVEIAFLVSDGPGKWIAVSKIPSFTQERICLWHTPSGRLPLLGPTHHDPDGVVRNPWDGWTERRPGADPTTPYFGAGHPGIIWLNARPRGHTSPESIGLSSFEWIGNWYRLIGRSAPEVTSRWWQRLRRWIKRAAKRVPRTGRLDGPDPEIWALPEAYHLLLVGTPRDDNP